MKIIKVTFLSEERQTMYKTKLKKIIVLLSIFNCLEIYASDIDQNNNPRTFDYLCDGLIVAKGNNQENFVLSNINNKNSLELASLFSVNRTLEETGITIQEPVDYEQGLTSPQKKTQQIQKYNNECFSASLKSIIFVSNTLQGHYPNIPNGDCVRYVDFTEKRSISQIIQQEMGFTSFSENTIDHLTKMFIIGKFEVDCGWDPLIKMNKIQKSFNAGEETSFFTAQSENATSMYAFEDHDQKMVALKSTNDGVYMFFKQEKNKHIAPITQIDREKVLKYSFVSDENYVRIVEIPCFEIEMRNDIKNLLYNQFKIEVFSGKPYIQLANHEWIEISNFFETVSLITNDIGVKFRSVNEMTLRSRAPHDTPKSEYITIDGPFSFSMLPIGGDLKETNLFSGCINAPNYGINGKSYGDFFLRHIEYLLCEENVKKSHNIPPIKELQKNLQLCVDKLEDDFFIRWILRCWISNAKLPYLLSKNPNSPVSLREKLSKYEEIYLSYIFYICRMFPNEINEESEKNLVECIEKASLDSLYVTGSTKCHSSNSFAFIILETKRSKLINELYKKGISEKNIETSLMVAAGCPDSSLLKKALNNNAITFENLSDPYDGGSKTKFKYNCLQLATSKGYIENIKIIIDKAEGLLKSDQFEMNCFKEHAPKEPDRLSPEYLSAQRICESMILYFDDKDSNMVKHFKECEELLKSKSRQDFDPKNDDEENQWILDVVLEALNNRQFYYKFNQYIKEFKKCLYNISVDALYEFNANVPSIAYRLLTTPLEYDPALFKTELFKKGVSEMNTLTSLVMASQCPRSSFLKNLLTSDSKITIENLNRPYEGNRAFSLSCLQYAVCSGFDENVEIILNYAKEKGADMNTFTQFTASTEICDKEGDLNNKTPLQIAETLNKKYNGSRMQFKKMEKLLSL